jgi:RHS repeat-associated protein
VKRRAQRAPLLASAPVGVFIAPGGGDTAVRAAVRFPVDARAVLVGAFCRDTVVEPEIPSYLIEVRHSVRPSFRCLFSVGILLTTLLSQRASATCAATFVSEAPAHDGLIWTVRLDRGTGAGSAIEMRRFGSSTVIASHTCDPNSTECVATFSLNSCFYLNGDQFSFQGTGPACTAPITGFTRTFTPERFPDAQRVENGRFYFRFNQSSSGFFSLRALPSGTGAPYHAGAYPGSGGFPYFLQSEGIDSEGTLASVRVNPPANARAIIARARSCDATQPDDVIVYYLDDGNCNEGGQCCDDCVGDPIRVANANMRYSEIDPLPANAGFRMERTYNSRFNHADTGESRFFGYGWFSPFDAQLLTFGDSSADNERYAYITDENNNVIIFWRRTSSSAYERIWPRVRREAASLTRTSTAFVYRDRSGNIARQYDATSGRLVGMSTADGLDGVAITWSSGLPSRIDSLDGQWALLIDVSGGHVASISVEGQAALTWNYSYGVDDDLVNVADANSVIWRTYTYDDHDLTEIHDAAGALLESHDYGAPGMATTSSGPSGEIVSVQKDTSFTPRVDGEESVVTVYASGNEVRHYLRTVGGRVRTVEVSGCASCGDNRVMVYDEQGNILREQDARGYITLTNYQSGTSRVATRQTAMVPSGCNPATDSEQCRLTPDELASNALSATAATVETAYAYADTNWPERPTSITADSIVNPTGSRIESFVFDAATGAVLQHAISGYTGLDQHLEVHTTTTDLYDGVEGAAFTPGGAFSSGWLSLPQPMGRRKQTDGPVTAVSDVTEWVYYPIDSSVPAVLRGRLAAVKTADGLITRYEDYDVFGNARTIVDANGVVTTRTFDHLGRPLTTTLEGQTSCNTAVDPLCATDLVSSRTYSPATGPLAVETDAAGGVRTYTYDARGRVETVSRGPSTSDLRERMAFSFDPVTGFKTEETTLLRVGSSWVQKRAVRFTYDTKGRPWRTFLPPFVSPPTDGDYEETMYAPGGLMASVKDARHAAPNTLYAYDAAGRLSKVEQLADSATSSWIDTNYDYDLQGNLAEVEDPNGNLTTYAYDDFGNLIQQVSPVTGTTTYACDAAGNLVSTTDANGAVTTRTYDEMGRILTATSTKFETPTEVVTYTYDGDPCGVGNGNGRVAIITSPVSSATYCYERRGLLVATEDGFAVSYGYDANGNRNRILYPSGRVVGYTYDFANRPTSASVNSLPLIAAAAYLPFGPLTEMTYGNGTMNSRAFDSRYRPQQNTLSGPAGTIASYEYTADAGGNITQINDQLNAGYDRGFGYDDLNRLVTANTGSSLWGSGGFSYDAMGNMLSLQIGSRSLSFAYVGTTPKIATVTGTTPATMTYDAAGNETGEYTARNHWVIDGEAYDHRGVRAFQERAAPHPFGGDIHRRWVYSPELRLLGRTDWETMSIDGLFVGTEYLWFNDEPVAQIHTDGWSDDSTRYTFADHLGTPILQTDDTAAVVWHAEYEPYGAIFSMRAGVSSDQLLRFPGQEADEDGSGDRYYNIFRWYRSGWGRYTSPDPIGLQGGLNLYAYAGGNPAKNVDPLGLDFINRSSRSVCAIKDGAWRVIGPGVRLIGDVDAVAAPKGQFFSVPPKKHRVYKWIDCYNLEMRGGPSALVSINLIRRTSSELDALPAAREFWCRCMPYSRWESEQRSRGGPVADFGDPPPECP